MRWAPSRVGGGVMASVTVPVPRDVDPTAVAAASRRRASRGSAWSSPTATGRAAALGCATALDAHGPTASRRWRGAGARWPPAPPATRPTARAAADRSPSEASPSPPEGGRRRTGRLPAASLHVPSALARRGEDVRLTLAAIAQADDDPEALLARLEARGRLPEAPLPYLDPDPAVAAPRRERDAARALRARRRARRRPHQGGRAGQGRPRPRGAGPRARAARPRAVLGVLREAFPQCYVCASAAATARSSPPAPSCSCAATACGPARSRSRAPRAAAPTPRSTTTSASSSCARARTARSRGSSRGGSSARCARTASG